MAKDNQGNRGAVQNRADNAPSIADRLATTPEQREMLADIVRTDTDGFGFLATKFVPAIRAYHAKNGELPGADELLEALRDDPTFRAIAVEYSRGEKAGEERDTKDKVAHPVMYFLQRIKTKYGPKSVWPQPAIVGLVDSLRRRIGAQSGFAVGRRGRKSAIAELASRHAGIQLGRNESAKSLEDIILS